LSTPARFAGISSAKSVAASSPTSIPCSPAFVTILAEDKPLPEKSRDHALAGEWRDHRECHLKPDLLLIYRKPNVDLLATGSHGLS